MKGAKVAVAAPDVSVVVPVYRNADTLRELYARLVQALVDLGSHEIIFVNDCCDGGSGAVLEELAQADPSILAIECETNLGQHSAVLEGLERSRGEWTIVLDADLQDPPAAIPLLIAEASRGVEAVFAGRRGAYESRLRLLSGKAYRRLLKFAIGTPSDAGAYVVLSRRMVERLLEMRSLTPGRTPALVAMIGSSGMKTASVPVEREPRPRGRSAYSTFGRVRSAVHAFRWAVAWKLHRRGSKANVPVTRPAARPRVLSGADIDRHNASQRRYFEQTPKPTMVPSDTPYLNRHVDELLAAAEIGPDDRVLEIGCGMGRYTLVIADRGVQVEGLDISRVLLDRLNDYAGERRKIPLHHADILEPPSELLGEFDAVIGFFALHHVHDVAGSLRSMARLLRPGGRMAFCEPNPFNPLYYVQIATRPGMTWAGDGGIVNIRRRPLCRALASAGIGDLFWRRFGFFPPFLANSRIAPLERPLESFPLWRAALPFQLFGGRLRHRDR